MVRRVCANPVVKRQYLPKKLTLCQEPPPFFRIDKKNRDYAQEMFLLSILQ